MKTTLVLFLVAAVHFFSACDIVEPPFTEAATNDTTKTDTVKYIRKVLIEDYTGHKCGNCPRAAEALDSVLKRNKTKVVAIAVHAGSFAVPSGTTYKYDFRNPVSTELDNFFGISSVGNPNGMVNRKGYTNSTHILFHTGWATAAAPYYTMAPDVALKIESTYDASARKVSAKVTTDVLNDLTGNYKLAVYMVEDSVIKPQTDYEKSPTTVSNYVHRHVLRGALNSTWGDQIITSTEKKGAKIEKSYSMDLNAEWNEKHCMVVAFVYDAGSYEVIQVEEKHVKE